MRGDPPVETTALLSVRDLTKRFGEAVAVNGASFELFSGEILALIGPSGCGKSTTLRMIAGFEMPDAGSVSVHGRPVETLPPERRGIGMVFQDYALFPHLSVLGNVAFARPDLPRRERADAAQPFLEMVGLEGFAERFPDELSGGQQQRVALARTLAARPALVLLDEPFSNLDAALRQATRREIRLLLKSQGIGALFVTHDQEEALSFADRVCVMRAGRVEQVGTPGEVYYRPRSAFVAGFLGRTNLLSAQVEDGVARTPIGALRFEGEVPGEGAVLLSIRPEHLSLWPPHEGAAIAARVVDREFKGHDMTYWVETGTRLRLQVDTDFTCSFQPGDEVGLQVRGPAMVVIE